MDFQQQLFTTDESTNGRSTTREGRSVQQQQVQQPSSRNEISNGEPRGINDEIGQHYQQGTYQPSQDWNTLAFEDDSNGAQPDPQSTVGISNRSESQETNARLASILDKLVDKVNAQENPAPRREQPQHSRMERFGLKVPQLELEAFSGDVLKYHEFRLTLHTIVDKCQLDPTEKYLLLLSKLRGSALKELPAGLGEASYIQGWINLNNRYDNRRVLIEQCLKTFLNSNPIVTSSHLSMLAGLQMIQQFQQDVRAYELELSDVMMFLAMKKLDQITLRHFENHLGRTTRMPSFEDFTNFLELERAICERTAEIGKDGAEPKSENSQGTKKHHLQWRTFREEM